MSTPDAEDASNSPEYSGDQDGNIDMAEQKDQKRSSDGSPTTQSGAGNGNGSKPASNAKDPLRPRRKKARRACYACQRAHLTCGDERPCQRCIKRGLQDACHDGVRKKAKYLHDAPNEALIPGMAGHYYPNGHQNSLQGSAAVPSTSVSLANQSSFYQPAQASNFGFQQNSAQAQMPPPGQDAFSNQQAPISPTYTQNQQPSMGSISGPVPQTSQSSSAQMHHFGGPLFDPSDPALFNFDIASLNFGNHYGALEFGMLGHMSSGAAETPPSDNNSMNPLNQAATMFTPISSSGSFDGSAVTSNLTFGPDGMPTGDWQGSQSRHNSVAHIHTPHNTPITANLDSASRHNDQSSLPAAYAIGAGPSSLASASPNSTGQDIVSGAYEAGPVGPAYFVNPNQSTAQQQAMYNHAQQQQAQQHPQQQPKPSVSFANPPSTAHQINPRKRRRDPQEIYESVKEPYQYTKQFHKLIQILGSRLPRNKLIQVAKALGTIRPSFIACTSQLDKADLIYAEKGLQRSLLTQEDYIAAYGTPSIILRRTGEIAAANKEFSILTGWRRDVLLGKDPNLNANIGSGANTPMPRSGLATPRIATMENQDSKQDNSPQPVFIAELLDEDSILPFFEDFSKLAFADSTGVVYQPCKLLKYQTKKDIARANGEDGEENGHHRYVGKVDGPIGGEAGLNAFGMTEGKVRCMYSWKVQRDVFGMPMLVVMHFLPILSFPEDGF